MRRCPECNSVFPDVNRFCDLDGTPLIQDLENPTPPEQSQPADNWKILAMGAVGGLAIGVVLFVAYYGLTRERTTDSARLSSNVQAAPPAQVLRSEPVPVAPEASPEISPSPSPSPSPTATTTPQPTPPVVLSSSPISTGATADTRVLIRLKNGATIDAEEAWQGKEGIWYRQRGVIALLDPAQVKSVERPTPTPASSPAVQPSNPK